MTHDNFRKKFLLPLAYCGALGLAVWSGDSVISRFDTSSQFAAIAPAAGDVATPAELPKVDASVLADAPELPALPQADAPEDVPLRIALDKPEIVSLSGDAVNVIVGSEENLRAVPDTNNTIILIPKKPGATYFKAIGADGRVLMQRHVIVGAAKPQYIRVRRACANGEDGCKEYTVYYCPDMCHQVNVIQDAKSSPNKDAPKDVGSSSQPAAAAEAPSDADAPTDNPNSENVAP